MGLPVNCGVSLLSSPSSEINIYVEVEFMFEVEGVPVKCLHQDNGGVAAHRTQLHTTERSIFSINLLFTAGRTVQPDWLPVLVYHSRHFLHPRGAG